MAERGRETLRHGPMKPFGLTDPQRPRDQTLCRGATSPGQQARQLVQHGRFPDQAEACRAGARFSAPSPASAKPSSRGSAACTAIRSSIRQNCSTRRCGSRRCRAALCRTNHRLRRLCRSRRRSVFLPAALPQPKSSASRILLPPPTTAHGALLGHITGGHIETVDEGPSSFQPMNVNFGLFPPLSRMPANDAEGNRLHGPAKTSPKRARSAPARWAISISGFARSCRARPSENGFALGVCG